MERSLIASYEALIDEIMGALTHDNHGLAVELARIPERIRGFGHVKARHLEQAKRQEAELLSAFRQPKSELNAAE
jgi:indolepyruvate ferredoxin oxidoreductase